MARPSERSFTPEMIRDAKLVPCLRVEITSSNPEMLKQLSFWMNEAVEILSQGTATVTINKVLP